MSALVHAPYNNVTKALEKEYSVLRKRSALRLRDKQMVDFHIDVVPEPRRPCSAECRHRHGPELVRGTAAAGADELRGSLPHRSCQSSRANWPLAGKCR